MAIEFPGVKNPHQSWFQHVAWVYFAWVFSGFAIILITFNHVYGWVT
jgi:hypothetical protein